MKGVVLSGGTGTRLRPLTYSIAKQLIPVGGEPILFYGLREMSSIGVEDVAIIISPQTGAQVRAAIGDGSDLGINPTFILQPEPTGLAAALSLALPFVAGDMCVMYLGDILASGGITRVVQDATASGASCQVLVAEVDRPESFGIVELDRDGAITRLVEKPKNPRSNVAIVGAYVFDGHIAEAVRTIKPSARGEYEITDAIQYLLEKGRSVQPTRTPSWWKDTGRKDDVLEANRLVLADLVERIEGDTVACSVAGPLTLGQGSELHDCVVQGPVVIGEGVQARNCVLGPDVSIGKGSILRDAELDNTVVMHQTTVVSWKIRDSLIGPESILEWPSPAEPVSLLLGQQCEVRGG